MFFNKRLPTKQEIINDLEKILGPSSYCQCEIVFGHTHVLFRIISEIILEQLFEIKFRADCIGSYMVAFIGKNKVPIQTIQALEHHDICYSISNDAQEIATYITDIVSKRKKHCNICKQCGDIYTTTINFSNVIINTLHPEELCGPCAFKKIEKSNKFPHIKVVVP